MRVTTWLLNTPGFLWRHRRSVTVLVLIAPLLLTGSLTLFAVNGLALGYVAFTALRLMQTKGK